MNPRLLFRQSHAPLTTIILFIYPSLPPSLPPSLHPFRRLANFQICSRHYSIGADGVIFALPGKEGADYSMRIYNSDGTWSRE